MGKGSGIFKPIIVVRLYGGLGNQLFTYASALRLANFNKAKLYLDTVSGFYRDYAYKRRYRLHAFTITTKPSLLVGVVGFLFTYSRLIINKIRIGKNFSSDYFITQEKISYDERLLSKKITHPILFEGFWQSELYFKDIADKIRYELQFKEIYISEVIPISHKINFEKAVAIHVRHFNDSNHANKGNVSDKYYFNAIRYFKEKIPDVEFWLFSDKPEIAKEKFFLKTESVRIVNQVIPNTDEVKELFLMSRFRYFIIANSTFSWWGAWLSSYFDKKVLAPGEIIESGEGCWGFDGLLPDNWITDIEFE